MGVPQRDEPSDKGGVCESWTPDLDCSMGKCLDKAMQNYPVEPYSEIGANLGVGTGRNSNTFAKCLASKCGFSAGPRVVSDAPGWSQSCPAGF